MLKISKKQYIAEMKENTSNLDIFRYILEIAIWF